LHLQQIIKIPGINDGDASAPPSSKATIPATKPVRQQPKGLRMRFRPIGFGTGKLGKLGSSSSSGDSSESDEEIEDAPAVFRRPVLEDDHASPTDEETSSNSDKEMEDAPAPAIKPKKSKVNDVQAKSSPLKRKHVDDQPATKSSSQPINVLDSNPLNQLKKKQKKSHQSTVDNPSVSTESIDTPKSRLKKTKHAEFTIPDLVSSPIRPSSSHASGVEASQESKPSFQKHSKKRSHEAEKTPGKKNDLSLHKLTKATDHNLTGEERRKKVKKLTHKDPK
jgi:hypothetical protein